MVLRRVRLDSIYVNFKNTQSNVFCKSIAVNPTTNDKIPKICVEIIHTDLRVVVCSEEERKTMGLGRVTRGHRVCLCEKSGRAKVFWREGGVS